MAGPKMSFFFQRQKFLFFKTIIYVWLIHVTIFVPRELMEGFQDTFSSPHDFASNFLHADFLGLYSVYCTSFAQGNECLERALNENGDLREFIEVRRIVTQTQGCI